MPPAQLPHTRPVWADISRSALLHNFRVLRDLAGPDVSVAAVIKANAYGHGATLCAPWLAEAGAEWLGVTCVEEAVAVRAVCSRQRILVLSGLWEDEADTVIEHCLTPVVWEPYHLELLEAAARRAGLKPQSLPVHLEIDTGMSRQGAVPSALLDLLQRFENNSPLRLEALMTHFHSPEELDSGATTEQVKVFATAIDTIIAAGLRPDMLHAGNSANLLSGRAIERLRNLAASHHARLMLRPGLALYGYAPEFDGSAVEFPAPTLRPVLSLKTRITSLRSIPRGASVGYNATFRAERPTRIALLPIGYADGVSRRLSNAGQVLIRGERAPVAGRVSMDQIMIDVSHIPAAAIGDEAVLIGAQQAQQITAEDLAKICSTIPYEILTSITARVPRIAVT